MTESDPLSRASKGGVSQATEMLRQAAETFDQRKSQDERWFKVRLAMAWTAVPLLPLIFITCLVIIIGLRDQVPESVVIAASGALFVDVVGLVATVWKMVLTSPPQQKLEPVAIADSPTDQIPEQ